ncbi:MAG: sugar phosphate isomerase/epimerase family protein [Pirellulaceae bacterium]
MNRTTRRQVLERSLRAGLAILATPGMMIAGSGHAGETADSTAKGLPSVKIGLHCAGWDPRPIGELFAAAHELSYDGVELAPPWQEKKYDMEQLYRMLLAAGTTLAPAAFVGGGELRDRNAQQAYVAKARKHARWIKSHGGRYVIYSTVGGRNGDRTRQETSNIREAFRIIAEVVNGEGCTPLYHNHHVGGYPLSKRLLEEDLELLDLSSWRLCVDTGHLVLALTDPVVFVSRWVDKVSWMHCKDVKTAELDQLDRPGVRWQDHFTPLGTGVVDFPRVFRALASVGYKSWLVVEQDNSPDPYKTSKISIAFLRRTLSALTNSSGCRTQKGGITGTMKDRY